MTGFLRAIGPPGTDPDLDAHTPFVELYNAVGGVT